MPVRGGSIHPLKPDSIRHRLVVRRVIPKFLENMLADIHWLDSFRAASRNALGALVLAASLTLAGCDPCSGVARCSGGPYLAIDGQIVDALSGRGVDGIRVDVVRRAGIDVDSDSLSVTTSRGGHWRVEFSTRSYGSITADVVVTGPASGYRVVGREITTNARVGEATVFERWVEKPTFAIAGELYLHGSADERVGGVAVEFVRTGGLELAGTSVVDGVVRTGTDGGGRVELFSPHGADVHTSTLGVVIGDLVVHRLPTEVSVIKDLALRSTYVYEGPTGILRRGVGPSLDYQGRFLNRATGAVVGGVVSRFERTGGIAIEAPVVSTSAPSGYFNFFIRPLATGSLQGRLIYRAPTAAVPETLMVSLPTFDEDGGRFYGDIRVTVP